MLRVFARLIIISVFVVVPLVFFARIAIIIEVSCRASRTAPCPEAINSTISSSLIGDNIFLTDIQNLCTDLGRNYPQLDSCDWQRSFPQQVSLYLTFTPIRYVLVSSDKSVMHWIDQKGVQLSQITSGESTDGATAVDSLPVITLAPELDHMLVSSSIEPKLHNSLLRLLDLIRDTKLSITQAKLVTSDEVELLVDGYTVRIDLTDTSTQLSKLSLTLDKLMASPMPGFSTIDLRFKYPVIKPQTL